MRDGRSIQRDLEAAQISPEDALPLLTAAAHDASTSALRLDACRALGAMAGRAWGTSWEVAERAAFVLLEVARETDAPTERASLLSAMGRGFRNLWLMPYVHARLSDDDEGVVAAAIAAAGGLAFPALEEAIAAGFLGDDVSPSLQLAAIAALGRMGADSAAARIATFVTAGPTAATAALAALTEIRSRAGEAAALEVLEREPPPEVLVAAVRYLAEVGRAEVFVALRRLARDESAELRIAAGLASRAFHGERTRDAGERILAALTESDRAVRAARARRLRTLPVVEVLEQAAMLLSDDPEGVVQIVAEVRAPEVTRMLLAVARGDDPYAGVDVVVRARAAGSIEANEPWERDALVALVASSRDVAVRVAAAQTIGAFAPSAYVLTHLASLAEDPSPALRGALLWALQLSARPHAVGGPDGGDGSDGAGGRAERSERTRVEAIVRRALTDADVSVRRRAAYVAGNLDASSLVPELLQLARTETERPDLRVAAFVGLGEIGSAARIADLVHLWNGEDDAPALGAASRALERAVLAAAGGAAGSEGDGAGEGAKTSLARVRDRLPKLLASDDARVRTAAVRVAGLASMAGGAVPLELVASLADDAAPRVREQAVTALGRLGGDVAVRALLHALGDADPAIQERAAEALLARGTAAGAVAVLDFLSRSGDEAAALRLAARLALPDDDRAAFVAALDAALTRVGHDHGAYELLLELKIRALDATRPAAQQNGPGVDAAIAELFPTWTRLSTVRGFAPLAKSLRTAETLYGTAAAADADHSAAIVLWTKSLEGYLHAWLAPRLGALQQQPGALWELVDRLIGTSWPGYQRWLVSRWPDPVKVGGLSVDVPLRSVVNALREFQERRLKKLDSPMSVTEWSRVMLFLAVDHPTGPQNVLRVTGKDAERTASLAHRLQVLAQVRNAVTHRSVAGAATLAEFRSLYYGAFESLTGMA